MDGGSSDDSVDIIKKYAGKLKFWKTGKDKGQWDAINKGFTKSTGEIMTWLNSDDILMPGTLNLIANVFRQLPNVKWVTGIPTTINQEGFIMHVGLKPAYIRWLIELGFYHGAGLGFIMQEGTFWRRDLWNRAGGKVKKANLSLDFKLWKDFAKFSELTPIFSSLAAFRLNPSRKTRDFSSYFREIGVPFPKILRILFYPFRLFVHFVLRKMWATPQIYYNKKDNNWYYMPGWINNTTKSIRPQKIINATR